MEKELYNNALNEMVSINAERFKNVDLNTIVNKCKEFTKVLDEHENDSVKEKSKLSINEEKFLNLYISEITNGLKEQLNIEKELIEFKTFRDKYMDRIYSQFVLWYDEYNTLKHRAENWDKELLDIENLKEQQEFAYIQMLKYHSILECLKM